MNKFWLLLGLSFVIGTTCAWTMNYMEYGHREAYFGEITMDGSVTADNVMAKLKEYHSDSAARAELDGKPVHDFGAMSPGSKGSHEFIVKNVGNDVLRLELGASTCKCTLGSLVNNQLAPGESTSVELEWTVSSDKTTFEQSAELRTNDPLRPAIRLVVQGLVISDIEFDPKQIAFGEVLAAEPFEFSTKLYNYYDTDIVPQSAKFGSEELTELSEVEFEPFEVSEADGSHQNARQGFLVKVNVKPGLRQGPLVTNLQVSFKKVGASEEATTDNQTDELSEDTFVALAECAGRVMGPLTILESSAMKSTDGGGYIWTLGRLDADDDLEKKCLVALKGSEKDSTNLTIGETYPSDVIEAEFGKPIGRGQTRLFPLVLKLKAGEELIDLLGKNKDDFGWLWIESDNPKVSRMKVAIKVLIEPRP
ncbi:hypothetical protein Mal15_41280 [Stieleria maiorica]|uniref:DUF1573 domain-containing protein n=1 Tax=Stieleria maiorica TaxID=2795974 RepID=A0A5B9MHT1_9BACT|nr:DUF1573 domain-containing protein [Stieleria maiorica]QEG00060.1 hypothetical protein Mal15_41280 [Stieleria maiorica]